MSENRYLSDENQCDYAENIDIGRDLYSIRLHKGSENVFTCPYLARAVIDDFYFCSDGKVYKDTGVEVANDATGGDARDIENAIKFNWYYYWIYTFGGAYLSRILIDDATNTAWSWDANIVDRYKTLSRWDNDSTYNMLNIRDNLLYIVNWKTISTLDADWVFTNRITFSEDIRWLTKHWPTFNVYLKDWLKAIWDWFAEDPEATVDLNADIRYVYQKGNTDFIVWWSGSSNSILYISQWYEIQKLVKAKDVLYSTPDKFQFGIVNEHWNYMMADYDDNLYLSNDWATQQVYSYWAEYNWFKKSFNVPITLASSWEEIRDIGMLKRVWQFLYYSYRDINDQYWVDKVSLTDTGDRSPAWLLRTNLYDGWDSAILKNLEQIQIAYRTPASSLTPIKVSVSTDWEPLFHELITLDSQNDGVRKENIRRYTLTSADIGNKVENDAGLEWLKRFSSIQFQIEMSRDPSASSELTPYLYDFRFRYSTVNS